MQEILKVKINKANLKGVNLNESTTLRELIL